MATATAYQSYMALPPEERLKRVQSATGAVPKTTTPTQNTPTPGMSATAAGATAQPMGSMPAYGSNVAGFDANNTQHTALANAGQQWATANAAGDTAGMSAAKALGQQIRSGVQGASYDSVKGISTLPTAQPTQVSMPPQPIAQPSNRDAVTNVRSSSELQSQSGDSLAIERAALKNAIDTTMQGLRNNASYSNKLIGDERRLNDVTRTQTANPFANLGRTSFNEGLVQRGRDIDDSARGAQLDNELNSYTQELMNFDRLSPERQRQIYNELLEKERNFGLNQAGVTGNYAGERTLAAQGQDFNQGMANKQFGLDESSVTGVYNGQQTQQAQNQQFQQDFANKGFNYQQTRDQRNDYESDRLFDYGVYRDNVGDEQWGKQFQQNVKAQAESMGYNYASLDQRERQMIADQTARKEEQSYQRGLQDISTGLEIYKTTGQMPENMAKYGINVEGLGNNETKEAVSITLDTLMSGQATPEDILKRVENEEKVGLIDPEKANEIRKTVYMLAPEVDPAAIKKNKEDAAKRKDTRIEGFTEFFTPDVNGNFKTRMAQLKKLFSGVGE